MGHSEKTVRRMQRELRQKDRLIRKRDDMISKLAKTNESLRHTLSREDGLWEATARDDRIGTDTALLHSREAIHDMLHDAGKLATMTSLDQDRFDHAYDRFESGSKRADAPPFAGDQKPDTGKQVPS